MKLDRIYRFTLTIVVIAAVIITAYFCIRNTLRMVVKKKAIEVVTDTKDIDKEEIKRIEDTLSDEEKETVNNIIDKHADDMMNKDKIEKLAKNKSVSEIKKFVKSEMTEEEADKVKEIYKNHRTEIDEILEKTDISEEDVTKLLEDENIDKDKVKEIMDKNDISEEDVNKALDKLDKDEKIDNETIEIVIEGNE